MPSNSLNQEHDFDVNFFSIELEIKKNLHLIEPDLSNVDSVLAGIPVYLSAYRHLEINQPFLMVNLISGELDGRTSAFVGYLNQSELKPFALALVKGDWCNATSEAYPAAANLLSDVEGLVFDCPRSASFEYWELVKRVQGGTDCASNCK